MNILDAHKIYYHAEALQEIKATGNTYPIHIQIGLTSYCNHRCLFCYASSIAEDSSKTDIIDSDALLHFLQDAKDKGLKAVTIVGAGEPLLHPNVTDILYGIHRIGLDIGIYTNGSKLKGEIAKAVLATCTFVRISINAASSDEHERVHSVKGQFEGIVENVRDLARIKQENNQSFPTIGAQFVFFKDNYGSMQDAAKLWKEVGIDYIAFKPLIGSDDHNSYNGKAEPVNDALNVIKHMKMALSEETERFKVYGKYEQYEHTKLKERLYKVCYGHNIDTNLLSDGNLTLCCNLFSEEWYLGNIYEESFDDIWDGERRKRIVNSINLKVCPKACRCDPVNEVIWDFCHPSPEVHPNFV